MIIRQAFTLLRQNPFFSVVSIIGTAVSIAFAMVVYMVYDIQTANIRPESHRDRMVYSSYGYSYRKADHSNANTGMSYQAAMIRPYSAEYWVMNIRRPIWMVLSSVLVR